MSTITSIILFNAQLPKAGFHTSRIQLYRERLSEKMCTRKSQKVIWDMIDALFLATVAVEPTFVAFS